jgi:hypothetical protein
MFRQTGEKAIPFILDAIRPTRQLLPQYTPQFTEARSLIFKLIGIAAVIGLGAIYGRLYATLPPEKLLALIAPLAGMALLIIWVLPDTKTAPSKAMARFLLGFFAVSVAWPDYLALQLPGLPWISFRRLFLGPMCLLLLVCLSTSADFRKKMQETLASEPLLWKLLIAFAIAQMLSIANARDIVGAVKNFINYQIAWTGVFFASVYAFRDENLPEKYLKLFLMAACFIAVIGVLELHNSAVLWKYTVPSFLQVDLTEMAGALDSPLRFGQFRVKSVYNQPLPFAEIMALSIPALLYFIFTTKRLWTRIALVGIDLFILYVLTLPQSRLGLIGFFISHALFILVWAGRIWMRNKFSIIGPTITMAYPVILLAVAAAVMSVGSLREKVIGGRETAYSDQTRKMQKKLGRYVILRSPLVGYGPRQGGAALPQTGGGRASIDNYFLSIALDYGFLGFIPFYWMLLLAMHRAFMISIRDVTRDNNIALVILTTVTSFLIIKGVLSEDDNHAIPFIMMGMLMAVLWRQGGAFTKDAATNSSRPVSPRQPQPVY